MKRIRLYNAKILTMSDCNIFTGEIWIKDSYIEYIGKERKDKPAFQREIDLHGNLIMPGFKNVHTHSAMTFARSYADGLPLQQWLREKIFPMEAKLTDKHVYYYTKLACMEYLSSGITAAFDMYYEPEAIVRASEETGFRMVLCGAINDFKESAGQLEQYYLKYNKRSELISYILGFHAEYTTSLELIKEIGKLAEKYHAPVFVHNSETQEEVEQCIRKYGVTPTKLFADSGIYNYGGGGFHCLYLTDEDIEIFKEKNLYAIMNVCSNMKLASGLVNAEKYQKAGMNLAIGTDGASSNNALDMFREMYILTVLQKVISKDASVFPAFETLKLAAVHGARAIGLNECDTIEVGKKADLIVINLKMPNMQPENDIINNLVFSAGKQNVLMTIINGKILYENGEYTTIDAQEVYYNVNQLMTSLK